MGLISLDWLLEKDPPDWRDPVLFLRSIEDLRDVDDFFFPEEEPFLLDPFLLEDFPPFLDALLLADLLLLFDLIELALPERFAALEDFFLSFLVLDAIFTSTLTLTKQLFDSLEKNGKNMCVGRTAARKGQADSF
ncbi:hypothetical protein AGDE_16161 [Angomonas deanei]|nr:hypothetical protein AGDE_16161 [Angomonas deanei]|eukprot:EPY17596.1 hypothetical protein AGDE_16161 [Angomonas deanei]